MKCVEPIVVFEMVDFMSYVSRKAKHIVNIYEKGFSRL